MGMSSDILKFKYKNFNKSSMPEFICKETRVAPRVKITNVLKSHDIIDMINVLISDIMEPENADFQMG
jgi:hypothetical protein